MALLLGSTASLLAHASSANLLIKPKALTGRHDTYCTTPKCGEVCVIAYSTPDCDFIWGPFGVGVIEDTAGSILPLSSSGANSLSYFSGLNKNATDCPYIQFDFFNSNNQSVGWTFIAPGQNYTPCVQFSSAAVSYSAVTMFAGVPESLLELEDIRGHGNLQEG